MKVGCLVIITLVTSTTQFFLKIEHLGFLPPSNNANNLRLRVARQFPRPRKDEDQEVFFSPLQTRIIEMKKILEHVANDNFQKGMKAYVEDKTGFKNTWLNRIS